MVNSKKKSLKKLLFIIGLIFSFIFSMQGPTSFAAEPQPGDSHETPIIISSKTDLEAFIEEINSGNTFENQYIKLSNDINLNATEKIKGRILDLNIAGYCILNNYNKKVLQDSKVFQGNFDGNGYTINCNVNINKSRSKGLALFGYVGEKAKIENLNISGYIKGSVSNKAVASICDVNYGTLENCNVKVREIYGPYGASGICNTNYGIIKNCEIKGKITSKDFICSGICGVNYGSIEDCKVFCYLNNCIENGIKGDDKFKMPESGGISSYNYGKIIRCIVNSYLLNSNIDLNDNSYYCKKVQPNQPEFHDGCIGGISSRNNGLIEKCEFSGFINGYQVGGICAVNYETISDCKTEAKVNGVIVGGISAQNIVGDKKLAAPCVLKTPGGYIKNCTCSGEMTSSYLLGNIVCLDFWNDSHSVIENCLSSAKVNKI